MSIICQHDHRLELRKSFIFWVVWQRGKCTDKLVYQLFLYSTSYFGHECHLTGKCTSQNIKKAILVNEHLDILCTYQGVKIKMMILA